MLILRAMSHRLGDESDVRRNYPAPFRYLVHVPVCSIPVFLLLLAIYPRVWPLFAFSPQALSRVTRTSIIESEMHGMKANRVASTRKPTAVFRR